MKMEKFKDLPYERVDGEKIIKEYMELTEALAKAESFEQAWEVHQKVTKMSEHAMTQAVISHIRHDIDTTDEFYDKENDYYDEVEPMIMSCTTEYNKVLFNTPFRKEFEV